MMKKTMSNSSMNTFLKYLTLKRSRIILILLLFYCCNMSQLLTANQDTKILNIYYSGNSHGVLEHCGCPGSRFGGLANRLYFVDNYVDRDNSILLDAGDFFALNNDSLKNYYAFKILQSLNYDALNIGELDLDIYLDNIYKTYNLPLVSSNIDLKQSVNKSIKPYKIINKNGISIGILGSIKKNFIRDRNQLEKVNIFNVEKFNKLSSNLKERVDILIFLSHLDGKTEKKIFLENHNIDIVISGHNNILTGDIFKDNNRLFAGAGKNSEYFGQITLSYSNIKKKFNKISLSNKFHKMIIDSIPIGKNTQKLLDEYNNNIALSILEKSAKKNKYQFYEDKFCIECHAVKETIHSNAFETIKDRKNKNECFYCHSTGYGTDTGYVPNEDKEDYKNINCSMCHKINKNTIFDTSERHNVRFILSTTCKRCHRKPHDMEFDYHKKKKKLMEYHK